jgi:hypothetical protein
VKYGGLSIHDLSKTATEGASDLEDADRHFYRDEGCVFVPSIKMVVGDGTTNSSGRI